MTSEAPRRIRRYDNRKLYDVAARRYVTLEELGVRVARGGEVEVEDQRTGEDLTSLVLAQILLEGLRQRTARIPRPLLVSLVRLSVGATPPGRSASGAAGRAAAEAERIARDLIARGRLSLEEALSLRTDIVRSIGAVVSEAQQGLDAGLQSLLGERGPRARASKADARSKDARKTRPRRPRTSALTRPQGARR